MSELNATTRFPADICEWVAPQTLQGWVQEELKNIAGPATASPKRKAVLAVLSFAYARSIFDSEEILDLCRSDSLFAALSQGAEFSREDMVDVRHKDRGLLVTVTVRLLTHAVSEKYAVSAAPLEPALKRRLHECAVDRLDTAIVMDQGHGQ